MVGSFHIAARLKQMLSTRWREAASTLVGCGSDTTRPLDRQSR